MNMPFYGRTAGRLAWGLPHIGAMYVRKGASMPHTGGMPRDIRGARGQPHHTARLCARMARLWSCDSVRGLPCWHVGVLASHGWAAKSRLRGPSMRALRRKRPSARIVECTSAMDSTFRNRVPYDSLAHGQRTPLKSKHAARPLTYGKRTPLKRPATGAQKPAYVQAQAPVPATARARPITPKRTHSERTPAPAHPSSRVSPYPLRGIDRRMVQVEVPLHIERGLLQRDLVIGAGD